MVEKAEGLGLEFDNTYLEHYCPCFDSTLNDSMTWIYRIFGPMTREIPANLVSFLAENPSASFVPTNRMSRGKPCKKL